MVSATHRALHALFLSIGLALCAAPVRAQCDEWASNYHLAGIQGTVYAFATFDDGTGNGAELYVGGQFTVAGDAVVSNIAKWNGVRWASVGAGRPATVRSLYVWNDGTGRALYAGLDRPEYFVPVGGQLTGLAKWDGGSWTGLPGGVDFGSGRYLAMTSYDDGSGDALYVGGYFNPNYPAWPVVTTVARFDGTTWSPVGNGLYTSTVETLFVHDDGSGKKLYAGGEALRVMPGASYGSAVVWNGSNWSLMSTGLQNGCEIYAFADYGGALVAGGYDTIAYNNNTLVAWNGTTWTSFGGQIIGDVYGLLPLSNSLYVNGYLFSTGGVNTHGISVWNGTTWSAIDASNSTVNAICTYDEGSGANLFAGTTVQIPGQPDASGVARWNGANWSALGTGADVLGTSYGMTSFDDGTGEAVYLAGYITTSAGVVRDSNGVWPRLGGVFSGGVPVALQVYDDGINGRELYAAGGFTSVSGVAINRVARWDGTDWKPLGSGIAAFDPTWSPDVIDMTVFDFGSGPRLVVVGDFDMAGGQSCPFVAAWDGTNWYPIGAGFNHIVNAVEVYDDGSGPALFVSGIFHNSGGVPVSGVARWNGSSWISVGTGGPTDAVKLHVHDDGFGPQLYAFGDFTQIGGQTAHGLGRWNGSTWSPFGGLSAPFPHNLNAITSFDDGTGGGPKLVVSGIFDSVAGTPATDIASFDGSSWSALGAGLAGLASKLIVAGDGSGRDALYACGEITAAGGHPSSGFARYGPGSTCTPTTGAGYCSGDGSATACPCANTGLAGHGCNNSAASGGGLLSAHGQAHRTHDTLTLRASALTPSGTVLFFQGTTQPAGGSGVAFGDGLRCVGGSQRRLAIRTASGGSAAFGHEISGDASVSSAGNLPAGWSTRFYQAWYRDAQSFCTSATANLTNGLRIVWAP